MQKGFDKRIKIIIVIAMAALFVWFLILSPMIQFHHNEKTFEEAARRYYELNSDQLPTGERVKTLSLRQTHTLPRPHRRRSCQPLHPGLQPRDAQHLPPFHC